MGIEDEEEDVQFVYTEKDDERFDEVDELDEVDEFIADEDMMTFEELQRDYLGFEDKGDVTQMVETVELKEANNENYSHENIELLRTFLEYNEYKIKDGEIGYWFGDFKFYLDIKDCFSKGIMSEVIFDIFRDWEFDVLCSGPSEEKGYLVVCISSKSQAFLERERFMRVWRESIERRKKRNKRLCDVKKADCVKGFFIVCLFVIAVFGCCEMIGEAVKNKRYERYKSYEYMGDEKILDRLLPDYMIEEDK